MQDGFRHADNLDTRVEGLVRPIVAGTHCLIVTGYQDFLTAMALILEHRPDIADAPSSTVRIVFGENVETAAAFRPGRRLSEAARRHWLGSRGLALEHAGDLKAVLALVAVKSRAIDLRIYDAEATQAITGRPAPARLHAKMVVGPDAAAAGSANFSLAGLRHNIEYTDIFGSGTEGYEARRASAELFWRCGADWQSVAVDILERLLRFVTPQDAVCRAHLEMLGFGPWKVPPGDRTTGRSALPFQEELVYEAAATVHEHGVAFVEAPAGAGKTDIGRHLATILAKLHRETVPKTPRGDRAFAVVPSSVRNNWGGSDASNFPVITVTSFGSSNDAEIRQNQRLFRESAAAIVDEAHRLNSRWADPSRQSQAFIASPAAWSACLSATLLGNLNVDSLVAFHEARASLYMTHEFSNRMNTVFREGYLAMQQEYQEDWFGNIVNVERGGGRGKSLAPKSKPPKHLELSPGIRQELSEILSPFLCRRTRDCIGEDSDRRLLRYPEAMRPVVIDHADSGGRKPIIEEIERVANSISGGRQIVEEEQTRLGPMGLRVRDEGRLAVRNFLNLLRSSIAFARWELEQGELGVELRCLELGISRNKWRKWQEHHKAWRNSKEASLFTMQGQDSETPKYDEIMKLLQAPELDEIDDERVNDMLNIVEQHGQVVFLTERIPVLRVYAELLHRRLAPEGEAIAVTSDRRRDVPMGFRKTAMGDCNFRHVHTRDTSKAQSYMGRGGSAVRSDRPRAMFLNYERAEGINLQHASAVAMIGITSNTRSVVQGMGRIDRIDSPHRRIHYYVFDLSGVTLPSDRKAGSRLENMKALASGGTGHTKGQDLEGLPAADLPKAIHEHIHEPRNLRRTHLFETLELLRRDLPDIAYDRVSAAEPVGTWGADLCLLAGRTPFSLFVLRGLHDLGSPTSSPPRMIAVDESGRAVRSQVDCANLLLDAYRATVDAGLHETPSSVDVRERVIEDVQVRAGGLTQWDLRPQRTVALLETLAEFLGLGIDDGGRAAFEGLDLPSLEYLADRWAAELDGSWVNLKKGLRDELRKHSRPPGYLSVSSVVERFRKELGESDGAATRMRLLGLVEDIRRVCEGKPCDILGDICVVFHCVPGTDHPGEDSGKGPGRGEF